MPRKIQSRLMRSRCPIACTLDLVGDRWTLVIVRDMLTGKKRFSALKGSPEGIPTNILADRLRRMEETGLVTKTLYEKKPLRYEYGLTPKGKALLPVLQDICRWANKHLEGTWAAPASFMARKSAKGNDES